MFSELMQILYGFWLFGSISLPCCSCLLVPLHVYIKKDAGILGWKSFKRLYCGGTFRTYSFVDIIDNLQYINSLLEYLNHGELVQNTQTPTFSR